MLFVVGVDESVSSSGDREISMKNNAQYVLPSSNVSVDIKPSGSF